MNNKQDLIKWMTETRENLPFDSKAQLLKEFWDKRNRIKDLEQKEKKLEEKEQNYSTRVSNLENHANLLLNKKLSSTELIEELNRLKLLFTNAKLPNAYKILEEVCQQLLTISQMFNTDGLSSGSRPSSRSSSRPPSPTGEDREKLEELKEKVRFEAQKAQNYLESLQRLEAELDNKDVEIEEFETAIQQLKKQVLKKALEKDKKSFVKVNGIEFIEELTASFRGSESESSSEGEETDNESEEERERLEKEKQQREAERKAKQEQQKKEQEEKPVMFYDELLTPTERNDEDWMFSALTLKQWNQISENSGLKKGVFELRNFPNLKKLKIGVHRPYIDAPIVRKVDISGTASNLEMFSLTQSDVEEIIIGDKPNLKKMDVRLSSLKKLDLSKTKLSPKDYDTLKFPIREGSFWKEDADYHAPTTSHLYGQDIYSKDRDIVEPFFELTREKIIWPKKKEEKNPLQKQPAQQIDRSDWFTPKHWLTDKEIDWANKQILEEVKKNNKAGYYKILPAMDFYYIIEAGNTADADAYMAYPTLKSNLYDFKGKLVFIPVNKKKIHWSLLVYEAEKKRFYHYDTSGGDNYEYAKPLIKKLLENIHNDKNIDLNKYLIPKHGIHQGNGWDCGVAIIAFTERIIKEGINANLSDLDFKFGPERIKWRNKAVGNELDQGEEERKKQEEIEIYFEPIAPAQWEEITIKTGIMTHKTIYKMTFGVSERGEYRNEGPHLIGKAWKPSVGMISTYGEDFDPQPGNLIGKPLKKVILQGDWNLGNETSKNWVEAINKSKIKKGSSRNSTETFKIKGKVENYDETTATLTFSEGAEIEGIMVALPL